MSVTIHIDNDTTDRELAAIACLIAVMRSDQPIPAPPFISFDHSDEPAPPLVPAAAAAAVPAPPLVPAAAAAAAVPAPPAPPAPAPQPASETLLAAEAERAAGAAPPPPAAPVAAGDLDTDGLPWDARIHSTPATKNATDGRWRARRGLDEATKAAVTAELKAKLAGTGEAAAAPLPPVEPGPADAATAFGAGGADNASDPPAAPAPPAPAAAVPAPPAPAAAPAAEPGAITYPQIVTMANDKGMTYDALNEISVSLGLQKFAELAKRPDLFAMFVGAIESWSPPAPSA